MAEQDWRDALSSLAGQFTDDVTDDSTTETTPDETDSEPRQNGFIHIALEKKGRAGKTATIIFGFTIGDDELKDLAAEIKRALGCGGSARGGEILIQGDRVADCRKLLLARGYKIK